MPLSPSLATSTSPRLGRALDRIGPDVYQTNAFRVLQLSVAADRATVRRRVNQVRQALAVGLVPPPGPLRVLRHDEPEDEVLQTAAERTQHPEECLIDTVFWFWPPASSLDAGWQALLAGDLAGAEVNWLPLAREGDPVAMHNLAVQAHGMALLAEQRVLRNKRADPQLVRYWSRAWQWWGQALAASGTWSYLLERAEALGVSGADSAVATLCEGLPDRLLGLHVQLAHAAWQNGSASNAQRQIALMHPDMSRQPAERVRAARERGAAPLRQDLERMRREMTAEPDGDGAAGITLARDWLTKSGPLLRSLEVMMGEGPVYRGEVDAYVKAVGDAVKGYLRGGGDSHTAAIVYLQHIQRTEGRVRARFASSWAEEIKFGVIDPMFRAAGGRPGSDWGRAQNARNNLEIYDRLRASAASLWTAFSRHIPSEQPEVQEAKEGLRDILIRVLRSLLVDYVNEVLVPMFERSRVWSVTMDDRRSYIEPVLERTRQLHKSARDPETKRQLAEDLRMLDPRSRGGGGFWGFVKHLLG